MLSECSASTRANVADCHIYLSRLPRGFPQRALLAVDHLADPYGMATALDFHTQLVTSAISGETHAVTDADMAAGIEAGHGTYRTVCRELVLAAAMTVPPGNVCPTCAAILRRRAKRVQSARRSRRHRRLAGWLARIQQRKCAPAEPEKSVVPSPRSTKDAAHRTGVVAMP